MKSTKVTGNTLAAPLRGPSGPASGSQACELGLPYLAPGAGGRRHRACCGRRVAAPAQPLCAATAGPLLLAGVGQQPFWLFSKYSPGCVSHLLATLLAGSEVWRLCATVKRHPTPAVCFFLWLYILFLVCSAVLWRMCFFRWTVGLGIIVLRCRIEFITFKTSTQLC